jgi:hypothetical protein
MVQLRGTSWRWQEQFIEEIERDVPQLWSARDSAVRGSGVVPPY